MIVVTRVEVEFIDPPGTPHAVDLDDGRVMLRGGPVEFVGHPGDLVDYFSILRDVVVAHAAGDDL